MPYLIKGANVFTPKFLGKKDVLILEEKIAAIEDDLSQVSLPNLEVIEAKGLNLTPGFMDQHVHITGGGGEGGPETRCPETSNIRTHSLRNYFCCRCFRNGRTLKNAFFRSRKISRFKTRRHKCLDAYKQLFASAANADGIRERRSVLRA